MKIGLKDSDGLIIITNMSNIIRFTLDNERITLLLLENGRVCMLRKGNATYSGSPPSWNSLVEWSDANSVHGKGLEAAYEEILPRTVDEKVKSLIVFMRKNAMSPNLYCNFRKAKTDYLFVKTEDDLVPLYVSANGLLKYKERTGYTFKSVSLVEPDIWLLDKTDTLIHFGEWGVTLNVVEEKDEALTCEVDAEGNLCWLHPIYRWVSEKDGDIIPDWLKKMVEKHPKFRGWMISNTIDEPPSTTCCPTVCDVSGTYLSFSHYMDNPANWPFCDRPTGWSTYVNNYCTIPYSSTQHPTYDYSTIRYTSTTKSPYYDYDNLNSWQNTAYATSYGYASPKVTSPNSNNTFLISDLKRKLNRIVELNNEQYRIINDVKAMLDCLPNSVCDSVSTCYQTNFYGRPAYSTYISSTIFFNKSTLSTVNTPYFSNVFENINFPNISASTYTSSTGTSTYTLSTGTSTYTSSFVAPSYTSTIGALTYTSTIGAASTIISPLAEPSTISVKSIEASACCTVA
jgi:hypothetical protein